MKYLIRYLSVLLCFLLLSSVFCLTANAETDISPEAYLYTRTATVCNSWSCTPFTYIYNSNQSPGEFVQNNTTGNQGIPPNTSGFNVDDKLLIQNYDTASYLIKKGENTTFSIYNLYLRVGVNDPRGFYYVDNINYNRALINYMDGTSEYIDDFDDFSTNSGLVDLSFSFKPKKDVRSIELQFSRTCSSSSYSSAIQLTVYSGMSSTKTTTTVIQSSEESGLLKGIIEWLKGIKNGITDLFDSIAELPSKIWSFIENGLKNLFVPSEDFLKEYNTKWDTLLASRFGALYQVGEMIKNFGQAITEQSASGYINFPYVSLDSVGIPFSFGGYTVKVVPDGFEFIVTTIRLVISAVCTFLFINGMRKRYDNIMGDKE